MILRSWGLHQISFPGKYEASAVMSLKYRRLSEWLRCICFMRWCCMPMTGDYSLSNAVLFLCALLYLQQSAWWFMRCIECLWRRWSGSWEYRNYSTGTIYRFSSVRGVSPSELKWEKFQLFTLSKPCSVKSKVHVALSWKVRMIEDSGIAMAYLLWRELLWRINQIIIIV